MIAFAGHAASSDANEVSRDIYRQGTEALLECFVDPMSNGNGDNSSSTVDRNAMLLFAAMIGTRVLKEAAGDVQWVNELRNVVLDAATATK
jgi:TetR/AcrR family transcriptional repressor of nem operon